MTRKRVLQLTSLMAPPLVIALSSSTKPVTGATSNSVAAVAVATVTRTGGVAQAAVAVEIATGTGTTKYYHTPGEQRAKFAARPACYTLTLLIVSHETF